MTAGATSIHPRSPVVIGVGQFVNRDQPGREPVELMAEAVRAAVDDSGAGGVVDAVDTVAVVPTFSWRYRDHVITGSACSSVCSAKATLQVMSLHRKDLPSVRDADDDDSD